MSAGGARARGRDSGRSRVGLVAATGRDTAVAAVFAARKLYDTWARNTPEAVDEDPLPAGLMVPVAGVGEVFVRDTHPHGGGGRGTVLLLHGWLAASDSNWWPIYEPLRRAGWRVLAVDARGHGRGLRPQARFRLDDCADDAAALLRALDTGPVIAVGYSMGGAVAQILAFRHPELVAGAVLCATASDFHSTPQHRVAWYFMSALQFGWRLAPHRTWSDAVRVIGSRRAPAWFPGELARGAAWDIAEAGRELGRFDSRPWLRRVRVPVAVVATTRDLLVPVTLQRLLAERLSAPVIEVVAGHLAPASNPVALTEAILAALGEVERRAGRADPRLSVARRHPEVRRGSRGDTVAELQRLLVLAGQSCGQIDGSFGPATEAAVRRFQRLQGLADTGRVQGATWSRLLAPETPLAKRLHRPTASRPARSRRSVA